MTALISSSNRDQTVIILYSYLHEVSAIAEHDIQQWLEHQAKKNLLTRSFLAQSVHICSTPQNFAFFCNPKMTGSPKLRLGLKEDLLRGVTWHLLGTRVLFPSWNSWWICQVVFFDFIKCWIQLWQLCWCILGRFGWVLAGFHVFRHFFICHVCVFLTASIQRAEVQFMSQISVEMTRKSHDVVRSTRTASSDPVRFSSVGRPCEQKVWDLFGWRFSMVFFSNAHAGFALTLSV